MSSEALAKPTITRNSSEFKPDAYASLSAGELVVFAVQLLQADAAPVAVEEVVSTCFRFFPHSFALKNYFYWPDSALVSRRLHDAKEKGLLKGNATDGYETKVQGRQAAKHVAKVLGVSLPVPPKVEVIPAPPVEKKEEAPAEKKEVAPSAPAVKAVKEQETKKKPQPKAVKQVVLKKQAVKAKKEAPPPAKKKPVLKPKTQPKVMAKPKAKKVKPKVKPDVKKVEKTAGKKPITGKKEVKPTVKPVVKKVEPKVKKVVEKKEERRKKEAKSQPTQLTMALPPVAAKKKAEVPATKPKVKKEPLPIKGEVLAPVAASKEEKDKAAKVIKQLERSDAYQLYRRNGRRAQIGEFDFRNMLFATMESSAETLKRNVELFKRYAGIHFRTDLIAFLEFCEESFSSLLISKAKVKGKR